MQVRISALDIEGAEDLVREVDLPAIQDGPLYRLMFPSETTEDEQNEIAQWYTEGLIDALHRENDTILQICNVEGTPLGFCGWTIEDRARTEKENRKPRQLWIPETLDISAWLSTSSALRKERERVLESAIVCREYSV